MPAAPDTPAATPRHCPFLHQSQPDLKENCEGAKYPFHVSSLSFLQLRLPLVASLPPRHFALFSLSFIKSSFRGRRRYLFYLVDYHSSWLANLQGHWFPLKLSKAWQYLMHGPQSNILSITWELVRNEKSLVSPGPSQSETLRWRHQSVRTQVWEILSSKAETLIRVFSGSSCAVDFRPYMSSWCLLNYMSSVTIHEVVCAWNTFWKKSTQWGRNIEISSELKRESQFVSPIDRE